MRLWRSGDLFAQSSLHKASFVIKYIQIMDFSK